MAYGGYKFKGYRVLRSSLDDNTYQNWCLLIHQARIKAFMESCALSGAQWQFCKTDGDLTFENYGYVIYRVANSGGQYNDYLSFFKYGNEELYYMISTLGEYYESSQYGTPYVRAYAKYASYSNSGTGYKPAGMSSALSLIDFGDKGPFQSYPLQALPCTSIRTDSCKYKTGDVAQTGSPSYSCNETYPNQNFTTISTWYIGYATKGKDIINLTAPSLSYIVFCIESGDAFSTFFAPDDSFGLMKINISNRPYENDSGTILSNNVNFAHAEALSNSGSPLNQTIVSQYYTSRVNLAWPTAPIYKSGYTKQYYQSVVLFAGACFYSSESGNAKAPSTEGNLAKGIIKSELLSCTVANNSSIVQNELSLHIGGKMICTCSKESVALSNLLMGDDAAPSGYSVYAQIVVGWDESNPDPLDQSSWPNLNLL